MRHSSARFLAATVLSVLSVASASPAIGQAPSSSPADAELEATLAAVELMNEVPDGIRETCRPTTPAMEGMLAVAQCEHGEDTLVYGRFTDEPSLHAAYDLIAMGSGVSPDSGTLCEAGAFEGTYTSSDGSDAGRLVCQLGADGYLAVWTDPAILVLGVVLLGGEGGFDVLHEHWLAARLDASADTAAEPGPEAAAGGVRQWAVSAEASSQYGDEAWNAGQATGSPDTMAYGDFATAWAPAVRDGGTEWLELGYEVAVIPRGVVIWETSGNGAVSLVEAHDPASGTWLVLWEGIDGSPEERHGFQPPLEPIAVATDRLRISLDTSVPGWNEIDAVELVGEVPE